MFRGFRVSGLRRAERRLEGLGFRGLEVFRGFRVSGLRRA